MVNALKRASLNNKDNKYLSHNFKTKKQFKDFVDDIPLHKDLVKFHLSCLKREGLL